MKRLSRWTLSVLAITACAQPIVRSYAKTTPTSLRVENIFSGTLDVYMTETPGGAQRALGELRTATQMEIPLTTDLRYTPAVMAYALGSMKRTLVACSPLRQEGSILIATCGGR